MSTSRVHAWNPVPVERESVPTMTPLTVMLRARVCAGLNTLAPCPAAWSRTVMATDVRTDRHGAAPSTTESPPVSFWVPQPPKFWPTLYVPANAGR